MLIHSKDPEISDLNHLFLFSFNSTAWILIFCSVFRFWLGCNLGSLQYHTGSQSDAILIITYKDVSCSCSCQHSPCWCLHCILWCNLYQSKKLFAVHIDNESGNVFLGAAMVWPPECMWSCLTKLVFVIFACVCTSVLAQSPADSLQGNCMKTRK